MQLRVPVLVTSFLVLAACGGKVEGALSSDAGQPSDYGYGPDGGGSISSNTAVGSSVATNATSITVSTAVLRDPPLPGPNGGCAASAETITLNLESGVLIVSDCATGLYDAGAGNPGTDQSEMTIFSQKTLDSNQLADITKLLQSYAATSPPPKSDCGYDGTAFALDVTTSSGTKTTYWDEAYNCEYPSDISWVTPILRPLFNALAAL